MPPGDGEPRLRRLRLCNQKGKINGEPPLDGRNPEQGHLSMHTDLALHIQTIPLVDTHEHLWKEAEWLENGPTDGLQDLFANYVPADFVSAGASPEAMKRLTDASDPDLEGRFAGVRDAWEAIQFTGYGEAVRLIARHVYGLEEITGSAFGDAQARVAGLRRPGT